MAQSAKWRDPVAWAVAVLFWTTFVATWAGLPGCQSGPERRALPGPSAAQSLTVYVHNADLLDAPTYWAPAIRERYPTGAVVVVAIHGYSCFGEWWGMPDGEAPLRITDLIERHRRLHPTQRVVLIACNTGGHRLSLPGVTYSPGPVWILPDAYLPDWRNELRDWDGDGVGTLAEFVENPQ